MYPRQGGLSEPWLSLVNTVARLNGKFWDGPAECSWLPGDERKRRIVQASDKRSVDEVQGVELVVCPDAA